MNEVLEKRGLAAEKTALVPVNGNGSRAMAPTGSSSAAKNAKNEATAGEERQLSAIETEVGRRYIGLRGYLRLFSVTRVIAMLSLYLYLDQYEMHREHQLKHARQRMEKAERLTRAAVYGEKLYGVRMWFFHIVMLGLRRIFLGNKSHKEANQEKQAVWLKDKLIELGPTFIKMGQSMGTRPDLLPLPFVKALGELQDSVPPFPNEIAFARIEKDLGRKINEAYAEFELEPVAAASLGQVYRSDNQGRSRHSSQGRGVCRTLSAIERERRLVRHASRVRRDNPRRDGLRGRGS